MKIKQVVLTNSITIGTNRYTVFTSADGEISYQSHGVTIEQNGTGRLIPWHSVEYIDYASTE